MYCVIKMHVLFQPREAKLTDIFASNPNVGITWFMALQGDLAVRGVATVKVSLWAFSKLYMVQVCKRPRAWRVWFDHSEDTLWHLEFWVRYREDYGHNVGLFVAGAHSLLLSLPAWKVEKYHDNQRLEISVPTSPTSSTEQLEHHEMVYVSKGHSLQQSPVFPTQKNRSL